MKSTVCSFALSVLTILLIASCDSSTSPDTSGEQIIGTFLVDADQGIAKWIGILDKKEKELTTNAEGDTLYFDNPDGNAVQILKGSNYFAVEYRDSSYNETILDTTEASTNVEIKNPLWQSGAIIFGTSPDNIAINTNVTDIQCDSTYSPANNNLEITMLTDSGEFHKAIHVNVQGIVDAAKALKGCNQAP